MSIPIIDYFPTVVLANGQFPSHEIPLRQLHEADRIIVCDGAAECLIDAGLLPDYIVGDLDSLSDSLKRRFADRLHHNPDQETNDLTKAVRFAIENGWKRIAILGATGKREDHSLANISLLSDYSKYSDVRMLTDYGVFVAVYQPAVFDSFPSQQVSLFCIDPDARVSTSCLKYPLRDASLTSWWQGSLNESLSESFDITVENGSLIVFRSFEGK